MEGDDIKTSVTKETSPVLVDKRSGNLTVAVKGNLAAKAMHGNPGEEEVKAQAHDLSPAPLGESDLSAAVVKVSEGCILSLPRNMLSIYM